LSITAQYLERAKAQFTGLPAREHGNGTLSQGKIPMKEKLKRLFSRKLPGWLAVKVSLWELGLVFVGAGVIGMILEGNLRGFILILVGVIVLFFGLTKRRDPDN
jgi:hypothetical protein